jgi:dimethylamine/trimethylamine dehydrogenase
MARTGKRAAKYDILFEPVRIGPKLLRNRFVQVPHCMGGGSEYPGFQAHFRGMKAEGGWAGIFTEGTSIAPEADIDPLTIVRLWDEGDVRNLRLTTEMVHRHGALAGVELFYGGAPINSAEARIPLKGPSQTTDDVNALCSCVEMTKDDFTHVKNLYVAAALRSRAAGFDMITLYCAHAITLLAKFLLPIYNRRTDEYGGSLENRVRFVREVVAAVRAAVGQDCAVGIRFGVDTLKGPFGKGEDEGGIEADGEGHRFIALMDDLVDYWDINVSMTANWGEDAGPSRTHVENHERPYTLNVRQHTKKPVINVGRFTNPDTMVELVRSGQCDLIGAARPSIADPFLPKKIEEGRADDIRECIGCNMCVSKWEQGARIVCTQNPTSGEEYRRGWHPEKFSIARNSAKSVLVVGAGPAGLECARVLGERGMHQVHLVDRAAEIGGALRWITMLPGLGQWGRLINYRQIQLAKLKNVQVMLGQDMTHQSVLEYGADIVVFATGSHWVDDARSGARLKPVVGACGSRANVLTPEQIMVAGKAAGRRVVVFDSEGYFMGYSLATLLARRGHEVTFVTTHSRVSPYSNFTLEAPRVNREIRELCRAVVTDHYVTRIDEGRIALACGWTGREAAMEADSIVLVTQRRSDNALFNAVRYDQEGRAANFIAAVHGVGDCMMPNFIAEAVFSGHRLAREIDSTDPANPLPYIRERRLLDAAEPDYALGAAALSPMF